MTSVVLIGTKYLMTITNTATNESPSAPPITNGSIVCLPTGEVGEVQWCDATEAHIVLRDRQLGRGPWIFHTEQLQLASDIEAQIYADRCKGETREPVISTDGRFVGYAKTSADFRP